MNLSTTPVLPSVRALETNRYIGEILEGWDIGGIPNGGYSGMFGVLAMADAADKPDPITITAHYVRPTQPGPVEIEVDPFRSGRTVSGLHARMTQGGKDVIRLTGSFADLDSLEGPTHLELTPPNVGGPDDCDEVPTDDRPNPAPAFIHRLDARMSRGHAGFYDGQSTGRAEFSGWLRHRGGHQTTLADLFLFADAFPPPIFQTGYPPTWVATIELTVHFRARPTTDWINVHFTSPAVGGGLQTEDGELWDANGNLVAQSRQLALAPTTMG